MTEKNRFSRDLTRFLLGNKESLLKHIYGYEKIHSQNGKKK